MDSEAATLEDVARRGAPAVGRMPAREHPAEAAPAGCPVNSVCRGSRSANIGFGAIRRAADALLAHHILKPS